MKRVKLLRRMLWKSNVPEGKRFDMKYSVPAGTVGTLEIANTGDGYLTYAFHPDDEKYYRNEKYPMLVIDIDFYFEVIQDV